MKSIIVLLMTSTLSCFGQDLVSIPDTNFLKSLIRNGVDENINGVIEQTEAQKITYLNVSKSQIMELKGIEYFTSLNELDCSLNQIKSMDLSKNVNLEYLYSDGNQLSTIDISLNILLLHFHCASNQISKIDISKNESLIHIDCHNNTIDSLDLSQNSNLIKIEAYKNSLQKLDLTKNPKLNHVVVNDNPDLKQICINDDHYIQTVQFAQYWVKDATSNWNTKCITGLEGDLNVSTFKKVDRIYNSLGQEVKNEDAKNGLYIYQYSDLSTKKVMLME